MKPEQWHKIEKLYHSALEREADQRTAFLAEACAGNDSLRREVESLLAHQPQAENLLETPVMEVAAKVCADDQGDSLVGRSLGSYKILSRLGAGGMGEVYQARDSRLDRTVAIKLLPIEFAADQDRMRRFVREAKAASALNHPHVATIYEIGEVDGVNFIAMEYVEGQTLAARINGHTLRVSEIIEIGSQIADALDEAHGKGITHRDIKPANVMITPRGQVKVLDFGLAKVTREAQPISSDISTQSKTEPGIVMGTVPYMSPEQALGREVDHRSDLFSLGVALYEMVTGRLPFSGANTSETLDRILHAQPEAMARFNYDAPAELERIVRKCLEKDRERRYQSAHELLVDLKNLKRDSDSEAALKEVSAEQAVDSPVRRLSFIQLAIGALRRHKLGVLFASVAFFIVAVGLSYFRLRPLPMPRVTGYTQITRDGHQKALPQYAAGTVIPLVAGDSQLFFIAVEGGQLILTQVSSTGGESVAIPTPFFYYPWSVLDLSPSQAELLVANRIPSETEWQLWAVPVSGGTPHRLGNLMGHGAAWSPDGRQIVYAYGSELYLTQSDGTASHKLVSVTDKAFGLRWSPDGKRLRFTIQESKTFSTSLWEVTADGSNLHQLLPRWNNPTSECCGNWTADGKYYVFQSSRDQKTNIWAMRESAGSQTNSEPVQLTNGPMNFWYPAPSPDGRRLFVVGVQQRGELARYEAKTQRFESYLPNVSGEHLDFSQDGEWVTYVTYPEGDLWRSKVDGSQRLRLGFPPLRASLPRWSPDGKKIAFTALMPGKPAKTYLVSAEGGSPQQLTPEERSEQDPGWSPDGKTLVFGSVDTRTIHLLDLNTHEVSTLPGSEGMYSPRWSPDGRYIATVSTDAHRIMLFDLTSEKWIELVTMRVGWPHWSRDGKYVYFHKSLPDDSALYRVRIDDRKLERLVNTKDLRRAGGVFGPWIGWAPDDSPLVLRDVGAQDIYALEWQTP